MEEGFYEVDVKSLKPTLLYEDLNVYNKNKTEKNELIKAPLAILYGAHGKGLYSGQGVLVYSNNGKSGSGLQAFKKYDDECGSLSEWDGKEWKLVRLNQFVEVTGPGGIYGNKNPKTDPIWATGFDNKSVLVGVRDAGKWTFYRLPMASHSYDGVTGINTEWPRIRDIGTPNKPDYLMTMHGMFWRFPGNFTSSNSAGIRPRSAYLKVISDYTRWNDQLVFGCNDLAQKELKTNKRKAKGNITGPGQSNSNLWFTSLNQPDLLGPTTATGAVWLNEAVKAGESSEPFLFAAWPQRSVWIQNYGKQAVVYTLEVDENGNGKWKTQQTLTVEPGSSVNVEFTSNAPGEWIRVKTDKNTVATVEFSFTGIDDRESSSDAIFSCLTPVTQTKTVGGLLYGLGNNRRALGIAVRHYQGGEFTEKGYYELDEMMNLQKKDDPETHTFITERFAIPKDVVFIEKSSVLIIDDSSRRWRLPLGNDAFTNLTNEGALRICREVATDRDQFDCHGTFYELPSETANGFANIRPVASHNFRINDYTTYRGLLILTGIDPAATKDNSHVVFSEDGKATVWVGA
jgi:hypothetical protein